MESVGYYETRGHSSCTGIACWQCQLLTGLLGFKNMSASEKRPRHIGRWVGLVLIGAVACWYVAIPRVVVFYSKDGTKPISYVLNTQHTIVRGELLPGETTGDVGHIFPEDEFFTHLDWWNARGQNRCISITPNGRQPKFISTVMARLTPVKAVALTNRN